MSELIFKLEIHPGREAVFLEALAKAFRKACPAPQKITLIKKREEIMADVSANVYDTEFGTASEKNLKSRKVALKAAAGTVVKFNGEIKTLDDSGRIDVDVAESATTIGELFVEKLKPFELFLYETDASENEGFVSSGVQENGDTFAPNPSPVQLTKKREEVLTV